MNENLLAKFNAIYAKALTSKLNKWKFSPMKRFTTMFFRNYIYPIYKKEIIRKVKTIFDFQMYISLPSNYDLSIYGVKGSGYIPDIRLTRYLLKNVPLNSCFLDIGSNVGYYAMLLSKLVGNNGKVLAFEPSNSVFPILQKNADLTANIKAFKSAVTNYDGEITFYEFDQIHSEQNSIDISFYNNKVDEKWMKKYKPKPNTVKAVTLDTVVQENNIVPDFIKIDVQGAEYLLCEGAIDTFIKFSPKIIMEFPHHGRYNNIGQIKSMNLLNSYGYELFSIDLDGELVKCEDINKYFDWIWNEKNIDNDDMVFIKK